MSAKNILVLSSLYHYVNMSQMIEYLVAYKKYSKHRYYYHNHVYDFDPKSLDFDQFDVIMLPHNFWPMNLSEVQKEALKKTTALKVLFLQDEYQYVRTINQFMDEVEIDLMFTCVAEKDFDIFYPKKRIKSLKGVYGVLTGYVSDHMKEPGMFDLEDKVFDVGFRSRVSPYYLGTIGHEKFRIADKFGTYAQQAGLKTNISVNEEDRLSGRHWLDFIRSCRTQLGTPSGSSIIDFDGRLLKEVASYRRAFPLATFEEVFEDILKRYDGRYVIDTISPRTFESAAMGSTMVQLEGYYGSHIEPDVHYINLKADYSNMAEVVDQIKDVKLCKKIARQAHKDLIMSDKFHIRTHVEKFDAILDKHLARQKRVKPPVHEGEFYQGVVSNHHQSFKLTSRGIEYLDTLEARKIKMREQQNSELRDKAFISSMLERTGGEPYKKVRKGRAALSIATQFSPYRKLLTRSVITRKVKTEAVLKDILLLSVLKSAQSGYSPNGQPFGLKLQTGAEGVILKGEPGMKYKSPEQVGLGSSQAVSNLKKQLKSNQTIEADLMETFPLGDFASSIMFYWPVRGHSEIFRSAANLKFNFPALSILAQKHPARIAKVLAYTLTPATKDELDFLKATFEEYPE